MKNITTKLIAPSALLTPCLLLALQAVSPAAPLAPTDPTVSGSLVAWYADPANLYNPATGVWTDSSAGANHTATVTDNAALGLVTGQTISDGGLINGQTVDYVASAGVADLIRSEINGGVAPGQFTIIALAKYGAAHNRNRYGLGSYRDPDFTSTADNFNPAGDGTVRKDNGSVGVAGAVPAEFLVRGSSFDSGTIYDYYVTDTGTTVNQNGTSFVATTPSNDKFYLGDIRYERSGDRYAQVAIYTAALTQTQIENIAEWMAANPNGVPSVTLSTAADPVAAPYTVDVTFTADVNNLDAGDFVVSNGAASMLAPASGPASAYTILVTPTAPGAVTVDLPAGSATSDAGGIENFASNILTTLYVPPGTEQATVTLSTSAGDPVYDPYTVDVVFSENVIGLDAGVFSVANGTASNVLPASGPASVYTVTITPTTDGNVDVILPADAVDDDDDGLPNLASNTLVTEYITPTIPSVTLSNPAGPIVSAAFTVNVSFTEDVTGLLDSEFVVTNGTASNLQSSDPATYTIDITPTAVGQVSVLLPAGSVNDTDGEGQMNTASNILYANYVLPGTYTVELIIPGTMPPEYLRCLDLSGRDRWGLGPGESNSFWDAQTKTFGPATDLSLNDIPWPNPDSPTGSFDLSFDVTSTMDGIRRGGKGAFGTADSEPGAALLIPGESLTFNSFKITDMKGDLSDMIGIDIKVLAVYLGNESGGDGATINGQIGDGAGGGDTIEAMRNDIEPSGSVVVLGTGTVADDGYSINGIDITFEPFPASKLESTAFSSGTGFQATFSNLDTASTYELRWSPDLVTPFTPVAGSAKMPAAATDSFTDAGATLPGPGFYQLWLVAP